MDSGFPVYDTAGNALVGFCFTEKIPAGTPLSLVVVTVGHAVLLMLDRDRGQWEVPGGMIERGETPEEAAVRELAEETGIVVPELGFAALAQFDLVNPGRQEYAAIYHVDLPARPSLRGDGEALDFRWWDPREAPGGDASPIDVEIVRRTIVRKLS
jgi:8-oxo-dGTP diphosphatase